MSDLPQKLAEWDNRKGSAMLTRRYSFAAYRQTRDFLDQLAEFSKASGLHPHTINFGTTYVNLTIEGQGEAPSAESLALAEQIETLYIEFIGGGK